MNRKYMVVGGVIVASFALMADLVVYGRPCNIGLAQGLVAAAGIGFAICAMCLSDNALKLGILKPLIVLASGYCAILCFEVILALLQPTPKASGFVRGMYTPDPDRGYRLTESFEAIDDDGHVRVVYHTNTRGDRDEELTDAASQNIVLLGDSFAFGLRLDDHETIDKQIESQSVGRVRCYNLGVPGYGPPAILKNLEANSWFVGGRVVYLAYNNDVSSHDLEQSTRCTAHDGYIVNKFSSDGAAYSPADFSLQIRSRFHPTISQRFASVLRLERVAGLVVSGLRSHAQDLEHPAENVDRVVRHVVEMSRVATARGCSFSVAMVPSLYEVSVGRTAATTTTLMTKLRAVGITVKDLAPYVDVGDYWVGEGHFNARGARRAASALLEAR